MDKQSIFQQITGSEARVSPKSPVTLEMSDFTKSLYILSQDKVSSVKTTSITTSSEDEWNIFMEEHKDVITSLEENKRAKWQETMNVKIELAKSLNKSINSYMGYK